MNYVIPLAIIFFCAPAVFVPSHQVKFIVWIAIAALVIGIVGCSWPYLMPTDLLIEHPWVNDSPFQPQISLFWGIIASLFAFGLTLALGSRMLLLHLNFLKLK